MIKVLKRKKNLYLKIILISLISLLTIGLFLNRDRNQSKVTNVIEVDVTKVLADVSHRPLGLGLYFIEDQADSRLIQQIRDMQLGSLRFATSEYYLFNQDDPSKPKVSIQDYDNLWEVKNFVDRNGKWYDKLSFDEFISICKAVNAEPFLIVGIDAIAYTGNAPHATEDEVIQAAVDWVKYANVIKGYNVKYWEIGNESNLFRATINWTPKKYAETVTKISQAMKEVDSSIEIGANGMIVPESQDWWKNVMPFIKNDVDFLVTHQYSWMKNYQEWKNDIYQYDYNIKDAIVAIDKYQSNISLNVTENSSFNPSVEQNNNTWKMLHNFEIMGQTLSFRKINYVHFWTSRWFRKNSYQNDMSAFDSNYELLPMGYPLKIWGNFLEKQMVYSTPQSGKIRSWASYDPDDKSLNLFLLNKDEAQQPVTIELDNYSKNIYNNSHLVISGASPNSDKVVWRKVDSVKVKRAKIKTSLTPLSITVISLVKDNDSGSTTRLLSVDI